MVLRSLIVFYCSAGASLKKEIFGHKTESLPPQMTILSSYLINN